MSHKRGYLVSLNGIVLAKYLTSMLLSLTILFSDISTLFIPNRSLPYGTFIVVLPVVVVSRSFRQSASCLLFHPVTFHNGMGLREVLPLWLAVASWWCVGGVLVVSCHCACLCFMRLTEGYCLPALSTMATIPTVCCRCGVPPDHKTALEHREDAVTRKCPTTTAQNHGKRCRCGIRHNRETAIEHLEDGEAGKRATAPAPNCGNRCRCGGADGGVGPDGGLATERPAEGK